MELRIESISKEFQGTLAVDNVNCTMENGVYGLLGVNGAGKTTLMRMLCTLLKPTSGKISCDGAEILKMGAEYRKILGYLPQEFGFYPDLTVKDYLMYISSIKGLDRFTAKRKADMLLAQVGLSKVQGKKMKKLSGGMKRRAGIAQAILNNPKILILDEPTAGLDPNERVRFRNLISELASDRIVLLSTHIVSDVEYIANRIMLMKEGRLVQEGSQADIISSISERVWSVIVPRSETEHFMRRFKVSNIRQLSDMAELRIISQDKPSADARAEQMTLEDVFLYYFGEKDGEGDDVL